ncbi:MAG TPA: urease accessory protein UreD [Caldimonas sp.]|jgi:urease accessory protein|nr:urease accessory protein UreD [Caldimonas sp.]HEX2540314.1 urease accessory protein UreD [Caldimonas sp.]
MGWRGTLALEYRRRDEQTLAHDRHEGPLRVLRSLYPEGPGVCHSVLVHPPGGIVGGDVLEVEVALGPGAHALLTTPGATRFYRSAGEPAEQSIGVRSAAGTRLEWLPLETIAYSGCLAQNRMRFDLEPEAEMIGWDVTALGLPSSDLPFAAGMFTQAIELPGRWIERGVVRADDRRLLDSPLGWAGHRVLGVAWFAAGRALDVARRDALLAAARSAARDSALAPTSGATSPQPDVVVLRVLAPAVEPAMALLRDVWSAWRRLAWDLEPCPPRVWRT